MEPTASEDSDFPSAETATPGKIFGEYELLDEIARGGMGVLYRARQTKLNRIFTLKMILAGELASASDVQRFYNEAEAAASLRDPGIVPIFDIGEYAGQHYFSMGYIEGTSLATVVREGPLPACGSTLLRTDRPMRLPTPTSRGSFTAI